MRCIVFPWQLLIPYCLCHKLRKKRPKSARLLSVSAASAPPPASVHFATAFYFRILLYLAVTPELQNGIGPRVPDTIWASSAPGRSMSHVRKSEHLSSVSNPAAPTSPSIPARSRTIPDVLARQLPRQQIQSPTTGYTPSSKNRGDLVNIYPLAHPQDFCLAAVLGSEMLGRKLPAISSLEGNIPIGKLLVLEFNPSRSRASASARGGFHRRNLDSETPGPA